MTDCSILPAHIIIKRITVNWAALYQNVPPWGENTPVVMKPSLVNDSVSEEVGIKAVKWLISNWSGGPSNMRVDHLQWYE